MVVIFPIPYCPMYPVVHNLFIMVHLYTLNRGFFIHCSIVALSRQPLLLRYRWPKPWPCLWHQQHPHRQAGSEFHSKTTRYALDPLIWLIYSDLTNQPGPPSGGLVRAMGPRLFHPNPGAPYFTQNLWPDLSKCLEPPYKWPQNKLGNWGYMWPYILIEVPERKDQRSLEQIVPLYPIAPLSLVRVLKCKLIEIPSFRAFSV